MKVTPKRRNLVLTSEMEGAQLILPPEKRSRRTLERHAKKTSVPRGIGVGTMPPHLHLLFWYDSASIVANKIRAYTSKMTLHRAMGSRLYCQVYRTYSTCTYKENHIPPEHDGIQSGNSADLVVGQPASANYVSKYLAKYMCKTECRGMITWTP